MHFVISDLIRNQKIWRNANLLLERKTLNKRVNAVKKSCNWFYNIKLCLYAYLKNCHIFDNFQEFWISICIQNIFYYMILNFKDFQGGQEAKYYVSLSFLGFCPGFWLSFWNKIGILRGWLLESCQHWSRRLHIQP